MYNRTFWLDHIVNSQGAVIQQGTAMNQEHFNNIEIGVFEAQVAQDLNAIMQRLNADEAKNARPYIIKGKALTAGVNTVDLPTAESRNVATYCVQPVLQAASTATVAVTATQKNGFTVNASAACTVTFIITGGML